MALGVNRKWAISLMVLFGALGTAFAQVAKNDKTTEPSAVQVTNVDVDSSLSPQTQLARGRTHVQTIQNSANRIRNLLDAARQAKDMMKADCLSEKLRQVVIAGKTASDRLNSLKSAVEVKDRSIDKDECTHQYSVLSAVKRRVDTLDNDANQCLGNEIYVAGAVQPIVINIDPAIAQIEPTPSYWSNVWTTVIGRTDPIPPLPISPYQ